MQRVKPQLSYETLKKMYLAKYESGNEAESSTAIVSRTSLTPVNPQVARSPASLRAAAAHVRTRAHMLGGRSDYDCSHLPVEESLRREQLILL